MDTHKKDGVADFCHPVLVFSPCVNTEKRGEWVVADYFTMTRCTVPSLIFTMFRPFWAAMAWPAAL